MPSSLRVLFVGDVVGDAGRRAVRRWLPELRQAHAPTFIVCNGENMVKSRGMDAATCGDLLRAGVDVITSGNHVWDAHKGRDYIANTPHVLRPHNLPPGTGGTGATVFARDGVSLGVVNLLGRVFMPQHVDCPFRAIDTVLAGWAATPPTLTIVDFHAEATSEKYAFHWHVRGRVGAVVGTHTHVQTNDAHVRDGTAMIADVGMTGGFRGIIGLEPDTAHRHFLESPPPAFREATEEEGLSAALIDFDANGRATAIAPLRLGGPWS